ncbi:MULTISPECIES: LuxR C-terminal-related transcriptional regulator [Streptomyces]|uniref:LuxR C-terminal-related transcriptional regulator n=1 Tax=Streptomyces glycanivorans TaxID=3033808 RepID=A0ABY9JNT8_9ACTN|nr:MULTISPECIES: LuxR C-terminal-related transcriptional regulator [unclassified Streptomyces]WSQ81604.1 LuxR C-terminal-related transcriptional regulator [Streptomyces sp. NBC_01213]WLQ68248.1 LuxR C-terminal-related transcriptional regulator [Streptomyces sp. Alt3]WSQ88929.1 LuxR C-terminal-related transcriptional regulator [Streptomyces sp. NBC_01212]WSR05065.1 LuxR C-terminal-related transcriptional regulator [Streptomyces sp. NBC_01208]WSR52325.1 LuxR C-terminal-related transcriptional re
MLPPENKFATRNSVKPSTRQGSGAVRVAKVPRPRRPARLPEDDGPLPKRRAATTYIPALTLLDKSERSPSDELSAVLRNIELANLGTNRATVATETDWILGTDTLRTEAHSTWLAVLTLLYTGDLASARAQCERLAGDPLWARSDRHRDLLTLLLARTRLLSGDAFRASNMLGALLARRVTRSLTCLAVAWLVEALVQIGELENAHGVLLENGLADRLDVDQPDRMHILAARGALHTGMGQFQRAIDDYMDCGRVLRALNVSNPAVIPWRSKATLAALPARRYDLALALSEDELIAARRWGSPRSIGTALHAVAVSRGDETSVPLLDEAVRLLDVAGARAELTHALYDLGMLLLRRKDVPGGRVRLEAADAVARNCRNAFWSERARSALALQSSCDEACLLTRQQDRIAQLARAGYSNRQIAETLFLTVRTVEFHLSSVYRKLGISGRRQLVTAMNTSVS